MSLLTVQKINSFYGLSHILFDVSLDVQRGEMVCLLGRNGVGKSTTLKSIMGLVEPRSGSIVMESRQIRGMQAYKIARLGIGYVPENRIIFPDLTVLENLEMGRMSGERKGYWSLDKVCDLFPVLKARQKQLGGTLSGGEQQMLTIGRTLIGNPALLLLDEPSEGLAPIIVSLIYETIDQIRSGGTSIMLSEQNAVFALSLSTKAYILEKGQIRWAGSASSLEMQHDILTKYLGV